MDDIDQELAEVLPAIHALTGCDTTSKVGTKARALKVGVLSGYKLLYSFGRDNIHEDMIYDAEKFLVKCISNHEVDAFDELRCLVYHEKHLTFDIDRFPPTSNSIRFHILRAYQQCRVWLYAPFLENIELDALNYGYNLDDNGNVVSTSGTRPTIPENFPTPCNCKKCSRPKVCPCRVKGILCC